MRIRRWSRSFGSGVGLVVAAVAFAAFGAAPAFAAGECAPILPSSSVTRGMTGTGWSVVEGRDPEPFAVRVLGVLPNEIGPGRDMIVVEASSPAIERAGGIWFGMSGSPVYIDGKLVGAIAFGFGSAAGPTSVAGLTSAEDLAKILAYPVATTTDSRRTPATPATVKLPSFMVERIAQSTGTPVSEVASTMKQLKVPLSVSGLNARAMRQVSAYVRQRHMAVVPYGGASASFAPTAADPLQPGDNFAAVNSYGDVTVAGIGTTTYVCNGRALSFGHPFFHTGKTVTGANAADALTVVRDPVAGPFKLATVAEGLGRVDQDRLAGLRTLIGASPLATPIRSSVTAVDLGNRREGATDVVLEGETPFIAFLHLLSNIDSTFDAIGEGSATVSWTIEGTRAGGGAWSLSRSNMYASGEDIAIEASDELASQLDLLERNPFENVKFTNVRIDASVEEAVRQYTISRLLVSKNGGAYRARQVVRARRGTRLGIRVLLTPFSRSAPKTVDLAFRVPRRARMGAVIEVSGGSYGGPRVCFSEEECEGGALVGSFDRLFRVLAAHPRNNELTARLRIGGRGRVASKKKLQLDAVVRGQRMIFIELPGGGGAPGGEGQPPPEVEGEMASPGGP